MPTTKKEHQVLWDKLCRDPSLNDLPYKVETNRRGQLILTPTSNRRSLRMSAIMDALSERRGRTMPSFSIATLEGVKTPDVVWCSRDHWDQMQETGDPTTLAPEICVEVMSDSNDWEEMRSKRKIYLEAGANEVWVVDKSGKIRFFGQEEMKQSEIAPAFPDQL